MTLIASSNGAAQTPFTRIAEITDTTVGPAGVLPTDLDGDRTVDLMVNAETGSGLKVLAGRCDDSFEGSYRVAQQLWRVGAMEALD